jgi:cell division transport system permease protein
MNINSFKYCSRQTFVSLSRNLWLAVVSAGMIAISLAILGAFLLVAVNTNQLMRNIESNVEIGVFLFDGADIQTLETQLASLEGIHSITYVSKHEGLQEFGRSIGDASLFRGLEGENNPLPDMFRVRARQAAVVPMLAGEAAKLPGVEMVDYGEELVGRVVKITGWVNRISLTVSILLALGAVLLIITTIRLSVLARQDEISIMKYLGASDSFIRFPFLMEGMLMGWIGTLVAVASLGAVYYRLATVLQREALVFFLQPVTAFNQMAPIFGGLLVLGTLIGGLGSLVSIRRFLQV